MKSVYLIVGFIVLFISGIFAYNIYQEKQLENLQKGYIEQAKGMIESEESRFKQEIKTPQSTMDKNLGRDEDGDGLTYEEELKLGTSDNSKDSDMDGVPDPEDRHPAGGGETFTKTVHWKHGGYDYTTQVGIPSDKYYYYKDKERTWHSGIYATYMDKSIQMIAEDILDVAIMKNEQDIYRIAIDFVQSMVYEYDIDYIGIGDYPKYAIETMVDEKGDCEDTAYLMGAVLKAVNVDTILLLLPGHMATAVACSNCDGYYYTHRGKKFYYLETTGYGFKLGQIPSDYVDVDTKIIEIE